MSAETAEDTASALVAPDGAPESSPLDVQAEKERLKKLVATALYPPTVVAQALRRRLVRALLVGAVAAVVIALTTARLINPVMAVLFGLVGFIPVFFLGIVAAMLGGVIRLPETLGQVLDDGADLLDAEDRAELEALAERAEEERGQRGLLRRAYDGAKRLLVIKNLFDGTQEAFTAATQVVLLANPLGAALIGGALLGVFAEVFIAGITTLLVIL